MAISDPNRASQRAVFLCGSFVLLGVILAVCTVCQTFLFSKAGSSLTRRLRSMTFTAILSQECGWFDDKRHSVGVLSAHLSGDAANIQNVIYHTDRKKAKVKHSIDSIFRLSDVHLVSYYKPCHHS